jgi:hypothetical protein
MTAATSVLAAVRIAALLSANPLLRGVVAPIIMLIVGTKRKCDKPTTARNPTYLKNRKFT